MDFGGLGTYTAIFQSVWFLLTVPMLVVLVALWRRTRSAGLLWFTIALVAWPVGMRCMYVLLPLWISRHFTDSNLDATIMVSASAFDTIGQAILLLVGVVQLRRDLQNWPGNHGKGMGANSGAHNEL